jgi:polar amino acid transport system substrate-binding protein
MRFGSRWAAQAVLATGMGLVLGLAISASARAAELKLGANIGNVPWEFQDKDGAFVGFEIDLANEVGKRLGMEVKVVNIPFQGLFAAVQSGQIDAATSSITITKKRLESVSFAQPYYDSDQSLSVKADSGIASLKDMSGKSVGVDTGSTGDIWATAHQAEYKISEIRRYEGLAPAMLDLTAGRINGYISDIPAVQYYVKDKPELKVVERILTGEQYSMMFAKDSPLADKVDAELTKLKGEGFIAGLHEKWFGAKADAGTTTVKVAERPKL